MEPSSTHNLTDVSSALVLTKLDNGLLLTPTSSGPVEGTQSVAESREKGILASGKAKNGTRQRISSRDWDEKRALIESLYQKNSLSDTRDIMAKTHGFHAS